MGLHAPSAPVVRTANRGVLLAQRGVSQGLVLVISDVLSGAVSFGLSNLLLTGLGKVNIQIETVVIWLGVWLCWRFYQGLYPGYGKSPQTELRLHTVSTVQVLLVQLAAALAFGRLAMGVGGVVVAWLLILLLALLVRYGVRSLLIRAGNFGRPVSIIGAGQTASLLIAHLQANPAYGLIPLAAYDDNPVLQGTLLHDVPVRGSIEQALTDPLTEQALISIPSARAETQQKLVNNVYAAFPVTWVIPDLFGVPNQALLPHNIGSVATLEVRNNLRSRRAQFIKRTMDIVLSSAGVILVSPILLIIALLIRWDSEGAVVYKAHRIGKDMVPFECYKFRSMYLDSEEKLQQLLLRDGELRAEYETYHKLKNDPRITKVGSVLRKLSLDELPQIFNVLMGTMSLIGPRPYLLREKEKMAGEEYFISQVRPGMTGYWQVTERSKSTFYERVAMDRFYITNWSPWLDLVILLQTVRVVIFGKGAY